MEDQDAKKLYKQVGDQIKEMRKERDWSQSELGYRAELDKSVIQKLERGLENSTLKTLVRVANAFQVEFYELFMFESNYSK